LPLTQCCGAAAAQRPPLLIDFSRPPGSQQQTRRMPWLRRKMGQADGQTEGQRIVT